MLEARKRADSLQFPKQLCQPPALDSTVCKSLTCTSNGGDDDDNKKSFLKALTQTKIHFICPIMRDRLDSTASHCHGSSSLQKSQTTQKCGWGQRDTTLNRLKMFMSMGMSQHLLGTDMLNNRAFSILSQILTTSR